MGKIKNYFRQLWDVLAIHGIFNFFNDDSGNLIPDAGMDVLCDEKKYKEVMKAHEEDKREIPCICEDNANGSPTSGWCQRHHTDWL